MLLLINAVLVMSTLYGGFGPSRLAVDRSEEATKRTLTQVDALYAQRADLARLRDAISLLERAKESEPDGYEINFRLAKFNYYLATHTADKTERDEALKRGSAAGSSSVKARPAEPGGHFWWGAIMGERARTQGSLKALNTVDDIRREMETVLKLDEGYQDGSAYMVLAQVDLSVPGFFGGSKKRAVEYLERGLPFGKRNAFLRLKLAEAYLAVKRNDEARTQLEEIVAMGPHPDYKPEYAEALKEARRLLDEHFGDSH